MPTVTYVLDDGRIRTLEAHSGSSLMQIAVEHAVEGIDGECGGACACATCHVYVDASHLARLPSPGRMESEMLGFVSAPRRANSRLACQLTMTPALDGIVLRVPERQR